MHWRTPRGSYVDVNSQLALDFAYQEKTICDVSRVFKPSKKYVFNCHNMQHAHHKTDRNKGSENVFHKTRDVGMVKAYPMCPEAGEC